MKPVIGFIGLGIMGRHMAGHLLNAGCQLVVHDLVTEATEAAVQAGAEAALSSRAVAERSDVVISMVPDSPDVEAVALGEQGILPAARAGLIYADMSTIAPQMAVNVATVLGKRGVRCLDAPVSGGETGARNAALSIMVGSSADDFDAMLPIFQVMGKTVTHCGPNGAGQTVKACNQIQVAMNFAGMAEALVFGARAGVDPAVVLKVLSAGYAQTRVMDVRGPKIIQGEFEPGFKSRLHYKDLNIVMATARDLHIALPATAVVHELFSSLLAAGGGDLDHSAIITVLERLVGVEARTGQGNNA